MSETTIDLSASTTLKIILRAATGAPLTFNLTRDGAALPITTATIKYMADLSTPLTKTVGAGITITDGPNGRFTLAFTAADTSGQNASQAVAHECKIKLAGEEPAMVFEGVLVLEKSLFTAMT